MIGDVVIDTMNNTATVADALESLFTARGLTSADTDLVIDEFDQWRNREDTFAILCQTFNLVVVAEK